MVKWFKSNILIIGILRTIHSGNYVFSVFFTTPAIYTKTLVINLLTKIPGDDAYHTKSLSGRTKKIKNNNRTTS